MNTQGSASVWSNATYMSSMPVNFQEMTDVKLVVEGVELPAHKTILAANSKVFAELFTSQAVAASSQSEVPLPDDNLQDTTIALTYLYRNCIFSTTAQSIDCREDAKALIRFGHKYGMQGMLDAVETFLISQLNLESTGGHEFELIDSNEDVAVWTATAEKHGLTRLLAHCEQFMIKDSDDSLWHDAALVGNEVSRASLLRVLRGLQQSRQKMAFHCSRPTESFDPDIPTLLEWQQSAEA